MAARNRKEQVQQDEYRTGSGTRRREPLLPGKPGATPPSGQERGAGARAGDGSIARQTPPPLEPAEGAPRPDLPGADTAQQPGECG